MCPSSLCVSSFEECEIKTYNCAIENYYLCADGKCRKDCLNIHTNGCNSQKPFYCPSGKCVKYSSQCIDYRCNLEKPFICGNLKCVAEPSNCPIKHSSYLIEESVTEIKVRLNDRNKGTINIVSQIDKNERTVILNYSNLDFGYNQFTAGYQSMENSGTEEIDQVLTFSPVPISVVK